MYISKFFPWENTILSRIWKKSVLYLLLVIFLILVDSFGSTIKYLRFPEVEIALIPLSIFGIAISFIIQFRNTYSYQRFHEGREIWGRIVNDSRNFANLIRTMIRHNANDEEDIEEIKTKLIHNMVSCIFFIKHQLRDYETDKAQLIPYVNDLPLNVLTLSHRPNAVILSMHNQIERLHEKGNLNDFNYVSLSDCLVRITNHYGGCERIKNTPIPIAYSIMTYRLIHIYLVWMSVGLVALNFWAAVIIMPVATYIFLGFADIGREIMNPFQDNKFTFDLRSITEMIRNNLDELSNMPLYDYRNF